MSHESSPFYYCIDYPKPDNLSNVPQKLLSGWIITDRNNQISEPILSNNDGYNHSLTLVARPDVVTTYPDHQVIGFHEYFSNFDIFLNHDWFIKININQQDYKIPLNFSFSKEKIEDFIKLKKTKFRKLQHILECPVCRSEDLNFKPLILEYFNCNTKFEINENSYNFLTPELVSYSNIKPTINVSAHQYDDVAIELIQRFPDGLILDNGCGFRNIYYPNVVNFEIVNYYTTDVLGIGEKLPFKSNGFDAVFSIAVLEHVKNPFECAREIIRVLKPGGFLYAVAPFLQPFHGYPDHYYNMTSSGLKNLFTEDLELVSCGVPFAGLPIWSLQWFLTSYVKGLPKPIADKFIDMKISDLLKNPIESIEQNFVKQLSSETNEELACSNFLIARKPE